MNIDFLQKNLPKYTQGHANISDFRPKTTVDSKSPK